METTEKKNAEHLMNVSLTITVELGRCSMRVRDILRLGVGSLVALHRAADEPVDLLVNGQVMARGEIVAVDERFGVRIGELVKTQ